MAKRPPPARSPRPAYRAPLEVAYRPLGPQLVVSFRDCVLYLVHDGKRFRTSGIYHRGGPKAAFPVLDADVPRWAFTPPQELFVRAMMLGRQGLGPDAGFAA